MQPNVIIPITECNGIDNSKAMCIRDLEQRKKNAAELRFLLSMLMLIQTYAFSAWILSAFLFIKLFI